MRPIDYVDIVMSRQVPAGQNNDFPTKFRRENITSNLSRILDYFFNLSPSIFLSNKERVGICMIYAY